MKRFVLPLLLTGYSVYLFAAPVNFRLVRESGRTALVGNGADADVMCVFDNEVSSLENMPQELRSFLETYAAVSDRDADEAFVSFRADNTDTIGPLLGGIEYDQGTPYNDLCPVLNGARAVSGCVATAMAQVMRYWQYPAVGTGTAVYTSSNGAATYDFTKHPFAWSDMLETYTVSRFGGTTNYNADQATAVAELMLACGASVNMDYDAAGSGSYISHAYIALRDNFNYSSDIRYLESDNPDWDDWAEALRDQFDRKLPILYGGISTSGGHAFVLDGYYIETLASGNTRTRFHVNWGWNGLYNGWFLLPKLQPENNDNYSNLNQRIVINIYPKGYVGVENVEGSSEWQGIDYSRPVYNVLGVPAAAHDMVKGNIYIQDGHKFVY